MTSADAFIANVAGHAGISAERAERVTRIVLSGLGSYLAPATRQWIGDELPAPLAHMLREASSAAALLEQRVLATTDVTAGRARELIASVCRAVSEALSIDAVRALRAAAPEAFAALLVRSSPEVNALRLAPRRGRTLATGRPGSTHPISEAAPRPFGSVADASPHADRERSSAPGRTPDPLADDDLPARPRE